MAPCSLFEKYQGFGGTCSIHPHRGRPENACSRLFRNISDSDTLLLSTATHVAVECYSRYSVQISAQKTAVIPEIPAGFRTPFKNMLGTYVKLRHDRYVHVLSNLISHSMKANDGSRQILQSTALQYSAFGNRHKLMPDTHLNASFETIAALL